MSDRDRNDRAGNGEPERVVVRDRRRIDPVTGQVRTPPAAEEAAAGAEPTHPAGSASSAGFHPRGQTAEPAPQPEPAGPSVAEVELASQVAERTADLQRITAEYANYRRRVDRDREGVLTAARVQFVGDLLTVLDDLERAEAHGDLTGAFKSVGDKVVAVVQKLGLEAFGHEGEPFEPSVHEAVQHEPSEATGPTTTVVASVLRRGYRIADRVLRPAMVTVTDRADDDPADPAPAPEQV